MLELFANSGCIQKIRYVDKEGDRQVEGKGELKNEDKRDRKDVLDQAKHQDGQPLYNSDLDNSVHTATDADADTDNPEHHDHFCKIILKEEATNCRVGRSAHNLKKAKARGGGERERRKGKGEEGSGGGNKSQGFGGERKGKGEEGSEGGSTGSCRQEEGGGG